MSEAERHAPGGAANAPDQADEHRDRRPGHTPGAFVPSPELLAAWRDFYDAPDSQPYPDPAPDVAGAPGWVDRLMLAALQRVLDGVERRRALEQRVAPSESGR